MDPHGVIGARLAEMSKPKFAAVKAASMAPDPDSGHFIVTVKLPDGSLENTVIRADDMESGDAPDMLAALDAWVSDVATK